MMSLFPKQDPFDKHLDIYVDCARIMEFYHQEYKSSHIPKRKIFLDSINQVIEASYSYGYHYLGLFDALILSVISDYESFEKITVNPLIQLFSPGEISTTVTATSTDSSIDLNRKFNQHECVYRAIRSAMTTIDPGIYNMEENLDYLRKENLVIIIPESLQTIKGWLNLIMRSIDIDTNINKQTKLFSLMMMADIQDDNDGGAKLRDVIASAVYKIAQRNYTVGNKIRKDTLKRKAKKRGLDKTFDELADKVSDNSSWPVDYDPLAPDASTSSISTGDPNRQSGFRGTLSTLDNEGKPTKSRRL